MTAGEVETVLSQSVFYKIEPIANQPLEPDGLDLPFNLVR